MTAIRAHWSLEYLPRRPRPCTINACSRPRYGWRRFCERHAAEYDAEAARQPAKVICITCREVLA